MIQGNVIGVVQMVNKKNGHFTKSDEESFETFAVYCGLGKFKSKIRMFIWITECSNSSFLALHHASLYERIRRSEQKCKVALEVLSYHAACADEEYERFKTMKLPDTIPNLERFEFSPWSVENDRKPIYVLYMFLDLVNLDPSNANRSVFPTTERFVEVIFLIDLIWNV